MLLARFVRFVVSAVVIGSVSPAAALEWISRIDLTLEEVQEIVDQTPSSGFVPIYSKGTVAGDGSLTFDVVFIKPLEVDWEYRRYDAETYRVKDRELTKQGFERVSTHTYELDGTTWYNVIWHRNK